ncbi:MAG: nitroreductase family protein [Clostridia bacterium]|nr:nitroreductase family protein [Clostridia bacterium]
MEFSKVIDARYSCRSYLDKEIEDEKIQKILETGRLAPTAKNTQCQKIYVLKDKELIQKIESMKGMFNAPVALIVCGDRERECKRFFTKQSLMETDLSIITTYMMLEATNQGLGSCWVCYFNEAQTKELLGMPENIDPYNILLLGYPDENGTPSPRHFERRDLTDTIIEM